MKKALFVLMLFTLISFVFQASCEKRTVRPRKTHWDAVKEIIAQYPDIFRLGYFDTERDTLFNFYRKIAYTNADIKAGTLFVADDTLHFFDYITLIWGDSLEGKFHYRFKGNWYEKRINSIALTNGYFEWVDRYWLLMQFSGTVINSVGTTRRLYTLNIVSDDLDVTVSEPILLKLVKKDSSLIFGKGKQVTFTIDVPLADTSDFFFLHVKEGETYQKIPFTSKGNGIFSASCTTTTDPNIAKGYHHAIVDVVSRESVTDTMSEYDSKAWGIIYQIK